MQVDTIYTVIWEGDSFESPVMICKGTNVDKENFYFFNSVRYWDISCEMAGKIMRGEFDYNNFCFQCGTPWSRHKFSCNK